MKTERNKKRLLLSSIVSVMLCITMFLGSTLAWFTDSASSTGNRIEAGKLKIDLLMDKEENGTYVSINDDDEAGDIFSIAEGGNGILWEPGKTEVVFLQVANKESLALTYNISLEVTELNEPVKLAKALEYAVIDGAKAADLSTITSWTEMKALAGVQLGKVTAGTMQAAPNGKLSGGESDYFALAVHMDEDAGMEFMKGQINIDVLVTATQGTEEYDSFGNTYDEDALFEGLTDLLVNGDFEEVNPDGTLASWSYKTNLDTDVIEVMTTGAESGANYLKLFNSSDTKYGHPYIIQRLAGYEPGSEVTFSAYVKKNSETTVNPQVKFQFASTTDSLGEQTFTYNEATDTEWTKVESTFTIPKGTSKFQILVRNEGGAQGEVYWDDLQLISAASVNSNAALTTEFLAKLAAEDAVKMVVPVPEAQVEGTIDTTPISVNGSFEQNDGVDVLDGWQLKDVFKGINSIAVGEGVDGTDAIRMKLTQTVTDSTGGNPYYIQEIYDVVPGVIYQISYKYKWISGGCKPTFKIESWRNLYPREPGPSVYVSGDNIAPETVHKDGEWHEVVGHFTFEENVEDATLLIRMLGTSPGEYLFDDVNVCIYSLPKVMDLYTDDTFYYVEEQSGYATFDAVINTAYHPGYADNQADFKVYDGQTLVWESDKITVSEGKASAQFPLSLMTKQESPYRVIATIYNDEGKSVEVKYHDIFLYTRPAYLNANGQYMISGDSNKIFEPIMGYHTYGEDDFAKASEGVNLFQIGKYHYAEELLADLDMLAKYGSMGMVALYNGTRPAGAEQNIENTINVLNDERVLNHPNLFGYLVMDEPYLNLTDPLPALERSYRLIREIDDNHPIIICENKDEKLHISSGYADILVIDPYTKAASKGVTKEATIAYDHLKGTKPIYALLWAYEKSGKWPTAADLRNNNYQALIAGADAVGYYTISDAWATDTDSKMAIWERTDDNGALWNAIYTFNTKEREIAYAHFARDESPCFNKDLSADSHWYYSWVVGNDIYMVVLGMVEGQAAEVTIPLTSSNGNITIGDYTATVVAGEETGKTGNGSLNMTVDGVEAVLYKISPAATIDYSSLN